MSLYEKVVEFVDKSFGGKQKPHLERTVYWYEQLLPSVSEAHKIAAYAHDIERAFRANDKKIPEDYLNKTFLKFHSEKGAEIISKFLYDNAADKQLIDKVVQLVSNHEVGGDLEQNALMEADSVSYFETNAEKFVKEKGVYGGVDKIQAKFDWMFSRIKSEKAREIARANYEKWSQALKRN